MRKNPDKTLEDFLEDDDVAVAIMTGEVDIAPLLAQMMERIMRLEQNVGLTAYTMFPGNDSVN